LWAAGINTVTATIPTDGTECSAVYATTTASFKGSIALSQKQINVSSTTTVYLVGEATFSAGAVGAYGSIAARRVR
jgi:hypothetical protein